MAQPLPYERDYDFTSFQVRHAATPPPGNKLDAEFDQIAATIDEVLLRIKDLQRDDLQLANSIVGYDQLKPELRNGFSTPTVWATGTRYAIGASVYVGAKVYAALAAHTSGVFAADLSAGRWHILADFTIVAGAVQTAVDASAAAAISATEAAESAFTAATAAMNTQALLDTIDVNDVTTLAAISTDITAAVANAADISTVAGISGDVSTVAGVAVDVATVAGIALDVTAAAVNMAAIIAAPDAAEAAAEQAVVAADMAAEASAAAALARGGAVPTRTALKALNTTATTSAYLTEAGREGQFIWRTGDYSAPIAADTQEGIHIKANAVAAASGAWVRQFDGLADAEWFGASAALPDNTPALRGAASCLAARRSKVLTVDADLVCTTYADADQAAFANITFVGNGSLTGIYRKHVTPTNAPSDHLNERTVFPIALTTFKAAPSPVAVLVGDSISTYAANSLGRQNMLTSALREHLSNHLGTGNFTFHNRAIGGTAAWQFGAAVATSADWYTNPASTWASYVQALTPDIVFLSFGMNPDPGGVNIVALQSVIAIIRGWAKVPSIVLCTPLVPSMSGAAGGTKLDQVARDNGAGIVRTYALREGLGLLDFHRQICMVRDGFDPFSTVLNKGDTVVPMASTSLGTREVYDFRAKISFNTTGWTVAGGGDSMTVSTGANDSDFLLINKHTSGRYGFALHAGVTGTSVNYVALPDSGVAMPAGATNLVIEKYRNRLIIYSDAVNLGTNTEPHFDQKIIAAGGAFVPKVAKTGSGGSLTSVAFQYGEARKNMPSLTDSQLWGENVTGGFGEYGGSGNNHPSGYVATHVYRPVLMQNLFR